MYDISCISGILHREIFKSGLSICWTNCQDSISSVAPFVIDPPGKRSTVWRMNASHSKMFPFFYTASLLKLLWQMKYTVSCRCSNEFPKSFLGSSYSIFSANKSTALAFYSNVWFPCSAILSVTSSIFKRTKKKFGSGIYCMIHNIILFLNITVFIVIILPLYKLG